MCVLAIGVAISGGNIAHSQSQGEMNRAADAEFKKADAEMNIVYERLRKSLSSKKQILLRDSQRAWLVFRDADVKFRALKGEGGSIYPMLIRNYQTELTRTRINELKEAERTFKTEGEM